LFFGLTVLGSCGANSNGHNSRAVVQSTSGVGVHACTRTQVAPTLVVDVHALLKSKGSRSLELVGLAFNGSVASIRETQVLVLEWADGIVGGEDPLLSIVTVVEARFGVALRDTDDGADFLIFSGGEAILGGNTVIGEVGGDGEEASSLSEGNEIEGVGGVSLRHTIITLDHGLAAETVLVGDGVFLLDTLVSSLQTFKDVLLGFVVLLLRVEFGSLGSLPLQSFLFVIFKSRNQPFGNFTLSLDVMRIAATGEVAVNLGVVLLEAVQGKLGFDVTDVVLDFSRLVDVRKMFWEICSWFLQDVKKIIEASGEFVASGQVDVGNFEETTDGTHDGGELELGVGMRAFFRKGVVDDEVLGN